MRAPHRRSVAYGAMILAVDLFASSQSTAAVFAPIAKIGQHRVQSAEPLKATGRDNGRYAKVSGPPGTTKSQRKLQILHDGLVWKPSNGGKTGWPKKLHLVAIGNAQPTSAHPIVPFNCPKEQGTAVEAMSKAAAETFRMSQQVGLNAGERFRQQPHIGMKHDDCIGVRRLNAEMNLQTATALWRAQDRCPELLGNRRRVVVRVAVNDNDRIGEPSLISQRLDARPQVGRLIERGDDDANAQRRRYRGGRSNGAAFRPVLSR